MEGKRKTKNHLEKDSRERPKQSWVEELESSQSGCTRQRVLVKQREGLIEPTCAGEMRLDDDQCNIPIPSTTCDIFSFNG